MTKPDPLDLARLISSVQTIEVAVASQFHIAVGDIRSECRRQEFAVPRHVVMWLARDLTQLTLPQIGRAMNRDHASVLHGVRRVEREINDSVGFRAVVTGLQQLLLPLVGPSPTMIDAIIEEVVRLYQPMITAAIRRELETVVGTDQISPLMSSSR